jgi:anti-sigma B factor antagonist
MMDVRETQTSVLHERVDEGIVVLYVEKGLKGECEFTLRERLDSLVRQGSLDVLVNLRHLPHVDSTELGRLIRAHISVRQAGGHVRLCNLSERVATVIKMSRLDTVLEIYGTEEEALEQIRRQRKPESRSAL